MFLLEGNAVRVVVEGKKKKKKRCDTRGRPIGGRKNEKVVVIGWSGNEKKNERGVLVGQLGDEETRRRTIKVIKE